MLWWVSYQESDKQAIQLEDMLGIAFLIQYCRTPPFTSSKMLCMRKQTYIWFIEVLLLLGLYKLYNAPCSLFVFLKPNTCIMCQRIIVGIQVCLTLLTKLTKMSISKRWIFFPPPIPISYTKSIKAYYMHELAQYASQFKKSVRMGWEITWQSLKIG